MFVFIQVLTVAGKKTGYLNTTVDAGASMTGCSGSGSGSGSGSI